MSLARFETLREQLLRAGIAPRHVRRYVAELHDHFDDLVREGMDNGLKRDAAEAAAHARIGGNDALCAVMLAQPQLRSITARFPLLVFGLGPLAMLPLVVVIGMLADAGLLSLTGWWNDSSTTPDWIKILVLVWNGFITYVAPVVLALSLCAIGIRQRMPIFWIVLGATGICVLGAFHEVGLTWSDLPGETSIDLGFAWAAPFPRNMIVSGIIRAGVNLALVGVLYYAWLRTRGSAAISK